MSPPLTRRSLLQSGAIAVATWFCQTRSTEAAAGDRALKLLLAGNQRYVQHQLLHPHQSGPRIQEIAGNQQPIACILGCADSRVPPEIIFDQGLGDLFVIRVAGNGLNDAVLGSIEYAAIELGVPLVLVLGHERCGAVTAAVQQAQTFGHISTLLQTLQPAIAQVQNQAGDPIDNAIRAHVGRVVTELRTSQPIATLVQQGKLMVVGARYDLDEGAIDLIA